MSGEYVGMVPSSVYVLADVLRTQATESDSCGENSQTALAIADMASSVPARMFERAENFRQAATVLDARALLAESFALQFDTANTDTNQTIDGAATPSILVVDETTVDQEKTESISEVLTNFLQGEPVGPFALMEDGEINPALLAYLMSLLNSATEAELGIIFADLTPEQIARLLEIAQEYLTHDEAVQLAGLIGNAVGYDVLDGQPLSDVLSIADLNLLIDGWNGTDNDPAFDALVRERAERMEGLFGGDAWEYDPAVAAIAEQLDISYVDAIEHRLAELSNAGGNPTQSSEFAALEAEWVQAQIDEVNRLTGLIELRGPHADHLLVERSELLEKLLGEDGALVSAALSGGAPDIESAFVAIQGAEEIGLETPAEIAAFARTVDGLALGDDHQERAIEIAQYATVYGLDADELLVEVSLASQQQRSNVPIETVIESMVLAEVEAIYDEERGPGHYLTPGVFSPRLGANRILTLLEENPAFGSLVFHHMATNDEEVAAELSEIFSTQAAVDTLYGFPGPVPNADEAIDLADEIWDDHHTWGTSGSMYQPGPQERRVDSIAIAYHLEELAKDDPVLASVIYDQITSRMSVEERIQLNKDLSGQSSWEDRIHLIDDAPGAFFTGAGKGFVNGFSDVAELAMNYGGPVQAFVNLTTGGAVAVDLPTFELNGLAEQGGANAMTLAEIITLPVGFVKSGPGLAVRLASKADEAIAAFRAARRASRTPEIPPGLFDGPNGQIPLFDPNLGRPGQQVLFDPGPPGRIIVPETVPNGSTQPQLFPRPNVTEPLQLPLSAAVADLPAPRSFRDANGVLDIDAAAAHYAQVVQSNQTWKWTDLFLDGLSRTERSAIRNRARDLHIVPVVPFKPGTSYLDFEAAGMVIKSDQLPPELWDAGRDAHFAWLNDRLPGGQPPGTTWHHTEIPGEMQLVPLGPHNAQSHVGLADWAN